ncbi:MAG: alpha/beta hydrolase domain-containing protein [Myxococcales bacterium]
MNGRARAQREGASMYLSLRHCVSCIALAALAACGRAPSADRAGTGVDDAPSSEEPDGTTSDPSHDQAAPSHQDPDPNTDASVGPDGDAPTDAGKPAVRRARPILDGTITGAIHGKNPPFAIKHIDLAQVGYVEEEFTLAGQATAYKADGEQGLDGKWKAVPDTQAAYKTRLLVRRPAAIEDFNGSVMVEWLNTTGGLDAEIGFGLTSEELLRGGYAWVGVSVQQSGVDALKSTDSERYAELKHPGDTYCYSIYAQAGAAIGWPGDVDAMGGFPVERLIAYGESQSAMRMITHVNAVQPLTHVFDGVVIHSRAGWGAPIGSEGNGLLGNGMPVRVRTDSDARVLQFFTESEIFLSLGPAYAARQPDSERLRSWEIAGSAHADQHMLGDDANVGCGPAGLVNDGPQHFVLKAALRAMHHWLKDDIGPPHGDPLQVDAEGTAIVRNADGNALGGIRTPAVDVPIATLTGEASPLSPQCLLFGQTIPFTPEHLLALYPTHKSYVDQVVAAAKGARAAGFLLPEEEATIVAEAQAAAVPK